MQQRLELRPNLAVAVLCELVALFVLVLLADDGGAWLVVAACCGALSIALLVRLARRRLWLDDDAVTLRGTFRTTRIRWEDVVYYMYWSSGVGTVVDRVESNGPFGAGCLKVVAADRQFVVIDNAYERAVEGVERAISVIHQKLRGTVSDFDPFWCDDKAVHHVRKGALELHEIEGVSIVNGQLKIRRLGAMLPWVTEHMKDVMNPLFFLEALAARRAPLHVSGTFIPSSIRAELDRAPSPVPRSTVVQRATKR